jgi:hypothetical protein
MPPETILPNLEDKRVSKNMWAREREMKIKIRGKGAGGDTCNARVGPNSFQ